MKYLRLIASDFDTLTGDISKQFIKNEDCPIFRAAKRRGLNPITVFPYRIRLEEGTIYMKGNSEEVERCQKELREGKKYATITITDQD